MNYTYEEIVTTCNIAREYFSKANQMLKECEKIINDMFTEKYPGYYIKNPYMSSSLLVYAEVYRKCDNKLVDPLGVLHSDGSWAF